MSQSATIATAQNETLMRSILQRIATGPHLSKDISRQEACAGMRAILQNQVHPVQAAIFLIALRMKRETDDENLGMLDALREVTQTVTAPVDEVVDIADPYDGFTRTMPPGPFVPAVLAACGVPTIAHGVETMGPKYGITHRKVLRAAGVTVDASLDCAAARLGHPDIGWAYLDQAVFCPPLHDLKELRTLIVKRPALTTLEVVLRPVRGRRKTHLVTGYVHKPYPRLYALLARDAGFDSALLVRGTEGGVMPSLRQVAPCFAYHDGGVETEFAADPHAAGIEQTVRDIPLPDDLPHVARADADLAMVVSVDAAADATAAAGVAALQGQAGPFRDSLMYATALILWHLRRYDSLRTAADAARHCIDTGEALARLRAS
jgi:anthranilate phosphoribosyltransferase